MNCNQQKTLECTYCYASVGRDTGYSCHIRYTCGEIEQRLGGSECHHKRCVCGSLYYNGPGEENDPHGITRLCECGSTQEARSCPRAK